MRKLMNLNYALLLAAIPLLFLPLFGCSRATEEKAAAAQKTGTVQGSAALQGRIYKQPYSAATEREALLDYYFELIKDLPFDFGKVGSIGEGIALAEMVKFFPETKYEIRSGLQYNNAEGRTLGELDILVFDKNTRNAVMVSEVKVSSILARRGEKALKQLERFKNAIADPAPLTFIDATDPNRSYTKGQFKDPDILYARIGNSGALAADYDFEYDLLRAEADTLQARIREYQGKN